MPKYIVGGPFCQFISPKDNVMNVLVLLYHLHRYVGERSLNANGDFTSTIEFRV